MVSAISVISSTTVTLLISGFFGDALNLMSCGWNKKTFAVERSGCKEYFVCQNRQLSKRTCPDNQLFDRISGICDWAELINCDSTDSSLCPESNGLFLKPGTSCRGFIECRNGKAREQTCLAGERFDEIEKRCDWKEVVDCNERDALCPRADGKFLKKGSGCKSYVICKKGKASLITCSGDMIFNPENEQCDYPELVTCNDNGILTTTQGTSTSEIIPSKQQTTPTKPQITSTVAEITPSSSSVSTPAEIISNTEATVTSTTENGKRTTMPTPITPTSLPTTEASTAKETHDTSIPVESTGTTSNIPFTTTEITTTSTSTSSSSISTFEPSTTETTSSFPQTKLISTTSTSEPETNKIPQTISQSSQSSKFTEELTTLKLFTTPEIKELSTDTSATAKIEITSPPVRTTSPRGCIFGDETCQPDEVLCPDEFGVFAHPDVLTVFIHCDHWRPYIKKCPDGLHFDPKSQVCDWPSE